MVSPSLWACWTAPQVPLPAGAVVLSFLSPRDEQSLPVEVRRDLVSARDPAISARDDARRRYHDLVAGIGNAEVDPPRTFRQVLTRGAGPSLWWFHRTSFKDSESDPAFDWIIAIHTIVRVAEMVNARDVTLVGSPAPIAAALANRFALTSLRPQPREGIWRLAIRALLSRGGFALNTIRQIRAAAATSAPSLDAALLGFWDWSVSPSADGGMQDRYFKDLPSALKAIGLRSIGWIAWLDQAGDPRQPLRTASDCASTARNRPDVVLLQQFLSIRDVVTVSADLRPLMDYLRARSAESFRRRFVEDDVDYFPLFASALLSGFLDAHLAHCTLMYRATARALARCKPAVAFSSFEHFPLARAQYAAAQLSATPFVAVQHASYGHDKTFLHLQPGPEFRGEPDGCAVPVPQLVCAIGTLGRDLFAECGYPPERIAVTGSPRYDDRVFRTAGPLGDRILIATALREDTELEMIEAAVLAARGTTVRLRLRSHPFRPFDRHPRFAALAPHVEVSHNSLDQDLREAAVVLFTHSTVADEAFLRGIPAWQWLSTGHNASALAEIADIRQFSTIEALRSGFADLASGGPHKAVSETARHEATERLFWRLDGGAAGRVAAACRDCLGVPA